MSSTINNNLPIIGSEGGLSAYLAQIKKFPMLDADRPPSLLIMGRLLFIVVLITSFI